MTAMEHVDRVVGAFLEDMGKAVAQVRAEVAAERDEALTMVSATTKEFHAGAAQLAAEREDFERHRVKQEADLEARWTELQREQERDKAERAFAEREIREMSQRATAVGTRGCCQPRADTARHVIDTHYDPSFTELHGIL